ncbi:MAG: hypothetical protein IPO72_16440 [Saprospiraceae bacterium]|nr:hypothetical protein [Candidatus Vicinibacter affinis]
MKKNNLVNTITTVNKIDFSNIFLPNKVSATGRANKKSKATNERMDESLLLLITDFYDVLGENLTHDDDFILAFYSKIFFRMLEVQSAVEAYKTLYPNNELFKESVKNISNYIHSKTIVDKTTISNLLVSPETNLINNGASAMSVFSVKAKVNEEGIYVKAIRSSTDNEITNSEITFE